MMPNPTSFIFIILKVYSTLEINQESNRIRIYDTSQDLNSLERYIIQSESKKYTHKQVKILVKHGPPPSAVT